MMFSKLGIDSKKSFQTSGALWSFYSEFEDIVVTQIEGKKWIYFSEQNFISLINNS